MDINLQGGPKLPQTLPGARSADPVVKSTDPAPTKPSTPQLPTIPNLDDVEQKRYDQVFKAAESFFKDVYAVSDTTFTIFKDASGQYITRYTSLRDGKVTYYPEPQLLQHLQSTQQPRVALVEIQA